MPASPTQCIIDLRDRIYGYGQVDLQDLRNRLNELDRQLLELIAERQSVVEQVGELKRSSS